MVVAELLVNRVPTVLPACIVQCHWGRCILAAMSTSVWTGGLVSRLEKDAQVNGRHMDEGRETQIGILG